MPDNKITAFDELFIPGDNDVFPIVFDPSGTPVTYKIKLKNFLSRVFAPTVPIQFLKGGGDVAYDTQAYIDAAGNMYVVGTLGYGLNLNNNSIVVYKSTDGGATWTMVGTPQSPAGLTTTPNIFSIAVDSNGLIGILFITTDANYPNCTNVQFMLWDGAAWNAVEPVSTQNTSGYTPTSIGLVVDSTNVWHAAWCQKTTNSTTSARLCYNSRTANDGGTWGSVTELDDANGTASNSHIIVDSNDKPHILFKDGGNSNYLTEQTNATGSWAATASAYAYVPSSLVIDSADTIYIGTSSNKIVALTSVYSFSEVTSTGRLFTSSQAIGIDTSDNLYVASTNASAQVGIYIQKYTGGAWQSTAQAVQYHSFSNANCFVYLLPRALATPVMLMQVFPGYLLKVLATG